MRLRSLPAVLLVVVPLLALTTGSGCGGGSSAPVVPTPFPTNTGVPGTPTFTATPTTTPAGNPTSTPTPTATPSAPIPTQFNNELLFSSINPGDFRIGLYRAGANGSNPRLLVSPQALENESRGAVIRPGGREIAFYSESQHAYLYRANANGTDVRRVPIAEGQFPAWNPGGTLLAALNTSGRLFVVSPDGSGQRFLPNDEPVRAPTFSPDGRSLFFVTNTFIPLLKRIQLDGAASVAVDTGDIINIRSPRFSPDGKTLAFVGFQSTSARGVYLANPDGSGAHLVPGTSDAVRVIWSPANGLAFETLEGLFSIARDGTNRRFIIRGFDFDWR